LNNLISKIFFLFEFQELN